MKDEQVFASVKESYGKVASANLKVNLITPDLSDSCCETTSSCCGPSEGVLSLGCYSKLVEKAEIEEGQTVLDLGSGAGHDLIQASEIVDGDRTTAGYRLSDCYRRQRNHPGPQRSGEDRSTLRKRSGPWACRPFS